MTRMRGFCEYSGIMQLLTSEGLASAAPLYTAARPAARGKIDVFAQTNFAINPNQRYFTMRGVGQRPGDPEIPPKTRAPAAPVRLGAR